MFLSDFLYIDLIEEKGFYEPEIFAIFAVFWLNILLFIYNNSLLFIQFPFFLCTVLSLSYKLRQINYFFLLFFRFIFAIVLIRFFSLFFFLLFAAKSCMLNWKRPALLLQAWNLNLNLFKSVSDLLKFLYIFKICFLDDVTIAIARRIEICNAFFISPVQRLFLLSFWILLFILCFENLWEKVIIMIYFVNFQDLRLVAQICIFNQSLVFLFKNFSDYWWSILILAIFGFVFFNIWRRRCRSCPFLRGLIFFSKFFLFLTLFWIL